MSTLAPTAAETPAPAPVVVEDAPATSTPKPRTAAVWLLTTGMAVAGAGVVSYGLPDNAPVGVPWTIPWWALALAFAGAELASVKISFRQDTHTISLSEIPLVFGLALASPAALITGRLLGSGTVLIFYRNQPPLKLGFNIALFNLETAIAVAVYRLWLGSSSPNSLLGWGAALFAVVGAVLVSAAMVDAVIAIHDRRRKFIELARSFATGSLISISVGFIGMVSTALVWHDSWAFVLIAGVVFIFFMLMRVYGSMSRRHDDLRAVYDFTMALGRAQSTQEIATTALARCRNLLRAELADIVLFDKDTGEPRRLSVQADGNAEEERFNARAFAAIRAQLTATSAPVQFDAEHDQDIARYFTGMNFSSGIVVPIKRDSELVGVIAVGNRIDPIKRFGPLDIELVEALAWHVAETLERAELLERLQAQVAANEDLIHSKDSLIAMVSHEMRTPLTTVLGYAEILGEEASADGDPARLEILKSIAGEAASLDNIVEDLLTAARDDLGTLSVAPRLTSVDEEVLSVLHGSLVPEYDVEADIEPARAYTDPERVRQIVRNLLDNAKQWGGDQTTIRVNSDGTNVHVTVRDNGPGVEPEIKPVMFAPYKPAHLQKGGAGSVGIGLTVSRRLARMMGGDLTYHRHEGWSVFDLVLPLTGPTRSAVT